MKRKYNNFYKQSTLYLSKQAANPDQILNTCLIPIEQLEKNEYFTTKYQTFMPTQLLPSRENQQKSKILIQKQQNKQRICYVKSEPPEELKILSKCKSNFKRDFRQTLNLNNYFHKQLTFYLRKLSESNFLNEQQQQICQVYYKSRKSFSSHFQLCQSVTIRQHCIQFLNSSSFIDRIFKSTKMHFKRKIKILKYLSKFQEILNGNFQNKNQKK